MDFSDAWKQLLSQSSDIQGGAFFTADGVVISATKFESSETPLAHCAAVAAIAGQLTEYTDRGEFDLFVLEGEQGYLVLLPVLDKAILAALVRKQAKLGLILVELKWAIDALFGPGLATDPILSPQPPKHSAAFASPDYDQGEF